MVSRDNIVFTLYVFTYTGIDFSVHMDGYRMYVKYVNFSVWGVPTLHGHFTISIEDDK